MKTIWKYPLELEAVQTIKMPRGSKILKLAMQNDKPTIWALVNPEEPTVDRKFRTVGTGHDCSTEKMKYIGTYFWDEFVGHVFELDFTLTETISNQYK